mgnify:CR=1 FL=1
MEILKVDKLCKTYGTGDARVEALKAVSLTLEKGEFAAVVGESGSGKSTLLNLVGGLDTPNAGKVFLFCVFLRYLLWIVFEHSGAFLILAQGVFWCVCF